MSNGVSEETHAKIAVEKLTADILAGTLAPGHKLKIDELKLRYVTGASPLREALARLTSLGFVTNESHRGFRVAPMSQADLADITHVRQLIEADLLREAIAKGGDDWEVGIISAFARLRRVVARALAGEGSFIAEIEPVHKQFHAALIGGSRSARLLRMQDLLFDQAQRYRHQMLQVVHNLDEFLETHEVLMDLALSRDAERALPALCEHIAITPRQIYPEAI